MAAGPLAFLGQADNPVLRSSVLDPLTGNPVLSAGNEADPNAIVERSTLLPLGVTAAGRLVPAAQAPVHAVMQGFLGDLPGAGIGQALYQFNQVAKGNEPLFDPENGGHVSDKNIGAVGTLAGAVMGLSPLGTAPQGAMRVFAGRNAAGADLGALAKAEQMQAAGVPRDQIWRDTGWGQWGGDWKHELSDHASYIGRPAGETRANRYGYANDALEQAYPGLFANTEQEILHTPLAPGQGPTGYYQPGKMNVQGDTIEQLRSVAGHEMQHGVQAQEGFARGGSPYEFMPPDGSNMFSSELQKWRFDQYDRLAGEVEARATQARMNLTPEERRASPPWQDFDRPEDQWIVRRHPSIR